MAPSGRAALTKRQKARADLKSQDIIWIGIAASEFNIQRIGTLLMLADWPMVEIERQAEDQLKDVIPMADSAWEAAVDWRLVRKDIVGEMGRLVKAGTDKAVLKTLIQKHGGTTVADVPNDNLVGLLADLKEMK